ncbi:MAG: FkbM family methyltransferase [Planctomycetaceae bacterium]|nr:FkbM family methyltransferase [Planctomycetaceae bacterium]
MTLDYIFIPLAITAFLAGCGAFVLAYRGRFFLHNLHRRVHLVERDLIQTQQQLAAVCRLATRTAAAANTELKPPQCHAQHGEELLLWEVAGWKRDGVFIEIGAHDGVSLSNSLFFEQIGWQGLLIEAHPDLVAQCRISRPGSLVVHAVLGAQDTGVRNFSMVVGPPGIETLSFASTSTKHLQRIESRGGTVKTVVVPARTITSVLREHQISEIDWMSIDVEGGELEVLEGLDWRTCRPHVLMIEDNSRGNDLRIQDIVTQHGYQKVCRIGCNDIYRATTPAPAGNSNAMGGSVS